MARTDAQASRTARGLMVLDDDCLHKVMTFLAVADARRGVGAAAKSLHTTAMSTTLARTRFSEPYTLRGDEHGVVHAMATACGTRRWPMEAVSCTNPTRSCIARAPPRALSIAIDRRPYANALASKMDDECFAHGLVDPVLDDEREGTLAKGSECSLESGAEVAYTLPFKLALTHFRFAFGRCNANHFNYWALDGWDRDRWRLLYESKGVSPWADECGEVEIGQHKFFQIQWGVCPSRSFASSCFRLRQTHPYGEEDYSQCMHIRGLELFGTILPPWRIE